MLGYLRLSLMGSGTLGYSSLVKVVGVAVDGVAVLFGAPRFPNFTVSKAINHREFPLFRYP